MTSPLPPLPPPHASLPTPVVRRSGGWVSLIIHVFLVLLLVQVTRGGLWWDPPPVDRYPGEEIGGGGGGRQVTMIAIPEAPRAPVTEVKIPPRVPVSPDVPTEIPPPVPAPLPDTVLAPPAPATTTGSDGGTGGGTGGGAGTGVGPGSGPGTGGSGTVSKDSTRTAARDPEPRQVILIPFDYPKTMRGLTIQVTFFVLANGRVDRVLLSEEIPDRGYEKKFEAAMRAYLFRPARSAAGLPVPGHTIVSITF